MAIPKDSPPFKLWFYDLCCIITDDIDHTLCDINSRMTFRYSDASGHRTSYAFYCGHGYIEWLSGGPAIVHFTFQDSHTTSTDVYPSSFRVRVNKCVQMLAGIVTSPDSRAFQCTFPRHKSPELGTGVSA